MSAQSDALDALPQTSVIVCPDKCCVGQKTEHDEWHLIQFDNEHISRTYQSDELIGTWTVLYEPTDGDVA